MSRKSKTSAADAAFMASIATIIPSQIPELYQFHLKARQPAFLWGQPGSGKTESLYDAATNDGVGIFDVRGTTIEASDVRGMPHVVSRYGNEVVNWSMQKLFPADLDNYTGHTDVHANSIIITLPNLLGNNGIYAVRNVQFEVSSLTAGATAHYEQITPAHFRVWITDDLSGAQIDGRLSFIANGKAAGIILLDEMNSADTSVLAAFYQLLGEYRVGDYSVPKDVAIFAAGNNEDDGGITFTLPTPLANRMTHYNVEVTTDGWLLWAQSKRINPNIIGFIQAFPDKIRDKDMSSVEKGFATGRSWVRLSKLLDANGTIPEELRKPMINGTVGVEKGNLFLPFYKLAMSLPSVESVLDGSLKTLNFSTDEDRNHDVSLRMAFANSLMNRIDAELQAWRGSEDPSAIKLRNKNFISFDDVSKELQTRLNNMANAILTNYSAELAAVCTRMMVHNYSLPVNTDDKRVNDFLTVTAKSLSDR